ncbi:acyl carrier protein [Nocardia transvalensis]|uniref:acyl carrier protein n=1 Tax=Nocardia transvalensis TaxID=37333 RepID=UPI001894CA5D|nr:acyl carrier protein [Nocardia transvalensis]MBF6331954.1 acyl carrier protein [Nocardia transvalensis]
MTRIGLAEISAIMDEYFEEFSGPIDETTTYDDLDFDSLVLVELGEKLSRLYGIPLPEEELAETTTFRELIDLLNQKMG